MTPQSKSRIELVASVLTDQPQGLSKITELVGGDPAFRKSTGDTLSDGSLRIAVGSICHGLVNDNRAILTYETNAIGHRVTLFRASTTEAGRAASRDGRPVKRQWIVVAHGAKGFGSARVEWFSTRLDADKAASSAALRTPGTRYAIMEMVGTALIVPTSVVIEEVK